MARLLLVEDDALVSTLLAEQLREAGHEVVCSPDGVAAFNTFRGADFDLVITDFGMPFSNGASLVDMIRYGTHNSSVPIVIISGAVPSEVALDRVDVQAFLSKPFGAEALTATIARLLARPAG